jgi:hypothetical protein
MSLRATFAALFGLLLASGPARAADEIHWTFMGQTSVAFDWRGAESTIRFGPTTGYGQTVTASTPSPLPFSSSGPFWEAQLTGLTENTVYHYSIGTGPDHTFKTPPPRASSGFTVYVEGDIGANMDFWRVGQVQSLIATARPDFCLLVGDLTYANTIGQTSVDAHFNDMMVWSQDAAYMPAWGNHEWDTSGDNLKNYKGRFALPNPQTSPGSPSISCCGEDWYWFDYGNVRFIAYPEPFSGAWSDWNTRARTLMDQAQADPSITFIVTFGHQPAYSSGYHAGEPELAGYMDALGTSHSKYVLNLNGHSHNYERSYPRGGVVHITAGTGGADLEQSSPPCLWPGGCPAPSWSAFRAMHHGPVRLTFSASSIRIDAICGPAGDSGNNINDITCTMGAVYDTYTIGTATDVTPPSRPASLRVR